MNPALLSAVVAACAFVSQQDADTALIRTLLDAFVANREAISAGEGEFLQTQFDASLPVQVALSAPIVEGIASRLLFAFDGKTCRIDELYDPELTKSTARNLPSGGVELRYTSSRILTDGSNAFELVVPTLERQATSAMVRRGIKRFDRFWPRIPLSLGQPLPAQTDFEPDFDHCMLMVLNSKQALSASVRASANGNSSQLFEVNVMKGGNPWKRFLVDLERGAIPLETQIFHEGRVIAMQRNEDIREIREQTWLPFHVRVGTEPSGGQTFGFDLRVASFKLAKPDPDKLRIPLPARAVVGDEITGNGFLVGSDAAYGFGAYALPIPKASEHAMRNTNQQSKLLDEPTRSTDELLWWKVSALVFCVSVFCVAAFFKIKQRLRP